MANQESEAYKQLAKANQLREDGDYVGSFRAAQESTLLYGLNNNLPGMAEAQAAEVLAASRLHSDNPTSGFMLLALKAAESSVRLAEASGDESAAAIPYHTLGKMREKMGDYRGAASAQDRALEIMENNPPAAHNRPGYIAEIEIHQAFAEFRDTHDPEALLNLEKAIKNLEVADEWQGNKDSWLFGGYMDMALAELDGGNLDDAREWAKKAEYMAQKSQIKPRLDDLEKFKKDYPQLFE